MLSRDDLGTYGLLAHGHRPAAVHERWVDRVSALVEGRADRRRLLIVAPPGHAKSTWASLVFPPWYLGRHPAHSVLFLTSSDAMARQYGGVVKSTLEGNEAHAAVFPAAAARPDPGRGWSTDGLYLAGLPAGAKDPSYRALGYGASVVGARAHGIILDDPLTQDQAQSAVEQARARRYHDLTVDSRLHPDGWELAIMTRWHDNDLASHLMAKPEWDVLHLPALSDAGEALWPERFPAAWLEAKRAEIGGPLFNTLYQGDPTGLGGTVFREAAWFRPLPPDFAALRPALTVVQFWDMAFSERQTADYTAAATLGAHPDGRLFLLGMFRRRLTPAEAETAMGEQIALHGPSLVGVEEAAFRQAVTADLVGRLQRVAGTAVRAVRPAGDKVARAYLPAARAEAGLLHADRAAPWYPAFEGEALGFPLAAHDDQVDALSGAVALAVEHVAALRKQHLLGALIGHSAPLAVATGGATRPATSAAMAALFGRK